MYATDKVGIICADGSLPSFLASTCKKAGISYILIVLKGCVSSSWYKNHPHYICRLGAVGTILNHLKKEKVTHVTLAGSLKRPGLAALRPDFTAMKWLAKLGMQASGDDGLLSGILSFLKQEGFFIQGVHEIVPELLMPLGCLTNKKPNKKEQDDIIKGSHIAKMLGRFDIGQAVIIENGVTLSVEGIEGTAELIKRTAALKREKPGVGVLVKMSKPQQSLQVDLPSIGPETVKQALENGLAGIVVEAGKSLILDKEKTIYLANHSDLFIAGVECKTNE
jgi:DUF1009 family protein